MTPKLLWLLVTTGVCMAGCTDRTAELNAKQDRLFIALKAVNESYCGCVAASEPSSKDQALAMREDCSGRYRAQPLEAINADFAALDQEYASDAELARLLMIGNERKVSINQQAVRCEQAMFSKIP